MAAVPRLWIARGLPVALLDLPPVCNSCLTFAFLNFLPTVTFHFATLDAELETSKLAALDVELRTLL